MGIESILKAGIKALPDNTTIKGAQLPNALKKMGVKDEELKFADIAIKPEQKYTKKDLEELEGTRKDSFGKETPDQSYQWVSLEQGRTNPTYRENVYTFAEGSGPAKADVQRLNTLNMEDGGDMASAQTIAERYGYDEEQHRLEDFVQDIIAGNNKSRYTSSHFPDVPNYLMHTRTYDDTLDGTPTRVVQEIQSDLHQEGRARGYDTGHTAEPTAAEREAFEAFNEGYTDRADDVMEGLHRLGYSAAEIEDNDIGELAWEAMNGGVETSKVPKSPYEKSWLAKGIERELDSAIEDGRQQLAIPIKGAGIEKLKRAEGVQKWYENNVVNTAKKIAKQNGMDFELTSATKGGHEIYGSLDNLELSLIRAEYDGALPTGGHSVAYDTAVDVVRDTIGYHPDMPEFLAEDVLIAILEGKPVAEVNKVLAPGPVKTTSYAIIKPKGEVVPAHTAEEVADLEKFIAEQDFKSPKALEHIERVRADIKAGKLKAERPNLKLYSSPAAAVAAGYAALQAGRTEDEMYIELEQSGYDKEEAEEIIRDSKKAQVMVDEGYEEEEVMNFFKTKEPEIAERTSAPIETTVEKSAWDQLEVGMQAATGNPKQEAYAGIISDEGMTPEQLLSRLQTISPNMSSITTRISGYFGNEVAAKKQEEAVNAAAQHIVNLGQEHGITLAFQPTTEGDGIDQLAPYGGGHWYVQGPEGEMRPVDEGFWEAMRQESNEMGYGIGGAFAGAKITSNITKNPWAIGLGSLVGAIAGASTGTQLDYLRDSVALHEEMSANVAAHKALTASEVSVIGDLVGYPLAKGAGAIWSGVKRTKDFILDGNTEGAYKALKDTMFLSESEVLDITNNLNRITVDDTTTMRATEEKIQATILSKPSAEYVLKAAASIDPKTGSAVAKAIDNRAKDVLATTGKLTDKNIGRVLTQDLSNYTADVKAYYQSVKEEVAKSPYINDFAWDFEELGIKDVLQNMYKGIHDDALKKKFWNQMEYINGMSDSRTLTDLLELRQMVNSFKFNSRITKAKDWAAVNETLSNIDGAIKQGSNIVMENPEQWRANYALAKTQYAKMKSLETNVIAKALRTPGISEETVVDNLVKYINPIDSSFQDVMSALPKASRVKAEGAVINALAKKFTDGSPGGLNVIHFPLLSEELDKVVFTMPGPRKAKAALKEMSEVFKNDLALAQQTGNIQIPKFQSYLTVDPVMRAKFEFASGVFNYVKRLAPTEEQRNFALVKKTAKLLEKPLNARLMKDLMAEVDDPGLLKQFTDLQREVGMPVDAGSTKVKLYGDGSVLRATGSGVEHQVPIHRIATYEKQKTIADKYGIDLADKKMMDQALKGEGYMAVQQGSDKVRRLK